MFTLDALRDEKFSWHAALSLASASKISYEAAAIVSNVVTNGWGFGEFEFLDVGESQGFFAGTDGIALIAFRGTESVGDWLGNLRVLSAERPYGNVHRGFLHGYQAFGERVSALLSQGGGNGRKVWVTGHSLGGALATIAAAELVESASLAGIYTYGQPRVGDGAFAAFVNPRLGDRFFRFVNEDDLVTRVPPGYRHVGRLIHFEEHGLPREHGIEAESEDVEPPPLTEAEFEAIQTEIRHIQGALRTQGAAEGQEAAFDASVEGLVPGVSDHSLDRYIAAIRRITEKASLDSAVEVERQTRTVLRSRFARPQTVSPLEAGKSLEGRDEELRDVAMTKAASGLYPVLLRVRESAWKAPPSLKVNSQFATVVSALASGDDLKLLEDDPGVVSIEVSRDAGIQELATSVPFVGGDRIHRPPIEEKGDAALVGIIDSGVDVLHEAFRDQNGKSRIVAYWNQRDDSGPTPRAVDPARFTQDYGTLYTAADIAGFLDGASTPPGDLRDPGRHGTHVAAIAAGRAIGNLGEGMAPEARVLVVVPNMKTSPGDPPSLGYSASHVDALYFLKLAAQGGNALIGEPAPIAVNVSLGMNAGAHDGSSTLEAAFDSITGGGRDPGYVIVKSAGNERGHGGHARLRAFAGLDRFRWNSSGSFRFQDYFEVWYSYLDELKFVLVDPAGNRTSPVSGTSQEVKETLNGNFCHLRLTRIHPDNGDNRLLVTIVEQASAIQQGRWTLEVEGTNIRSGHGQVDIWVERDNNRPVVFEDDEPEMTLSIPGTARTVVTVGACHPAAPLQLTDSSSYGLTRDKRSKPDICAPGFRILAASAGQDDHQAGIALTGTSMAAPHVTGALALALSHRHKQAPLPQYNARQLQAILVRSARFYSGLHHEGKGFGMLDVGQLFAQLP